MSDVASAHWVVHRCIDDGLTVATAESLTAGLIAATLAEVPGCSAMLRGGVVSYATEVKGEVLGIDAALLAHVVSEEVAQAMAVAVVGLLGADLGVSATGVAGPQPQDGQAPGTVWIAVYDAVRGRTLTRLLHLPGSRGEVRRETVGAALTLLAEVLGGDGGPAGE